MLSVSFRKGNPRWRTRPAGQQTGRWPRRTFSRSSRAAKWPNSPTAFRFVSRDPGLWFRITLIRIPLFTYPDPPLRSNAGPVPTFHLNADPDPALHQSDANLRPLVYKLSKASLWASTALHGSMWASKALECWLQKCGSGSIFSN